VLKLALVLAALAALPAAARADESDLLKAQAICKNRIRATYVDVGTVKMVYQWEPGFENCERIFRAHDALARDKANAEIEFVDRVAAGLK
jgi:hypothetical protein